MTDTSLSAAGGSLQTRKPDFQQKDYSQLVDLLNSATRQSLGEVNRDESMRLLWNVFRRQPRLVLLGLRGLLMGNNSKCPGGNASS